jgi:hypothetical protein
LIRRGLIAWLAARSSTLPFDAGMQLQFCESPSGWNETFIRGV